METDLKLCTTEVLLKELLSRRLNCEKCTTEVLLKELLSRRPNCEKCENYNVTHYNCYMCVWLGFTSYYSEYKEK